MALTVETGKIIEDADSFVSLADAITYATLHGNLTFADLDPIEQQEPSLRVAFDYLNTRWEGAWKGLRKRGTELGQGGVTAVDIFFTAADRIESTVSDLSTFTVGGIVRVTGSPLNGTVAVPKDFHILTVATNLLTVTETIVSEAAGPSIGLTGILVQQQGAWPRTGVFTPEGIRWDEEKVPDDIVNSQIEYALVAATQALTLSPTPVVDTTGRPLTKLEVGVGPLKQVKEWSEAVVTPIVLRDYPNADRLVTRWIAGAGRVIR